MEAKQRAFVEFARLALISRVFTVDETHQALYTVIEHEPPPSSVLIDTIMCDQVASISNHLTSLPSIYDPALVEGLLASELLKRYNEGQIEASGIASALYLQLTDPQSKCWVNYHDKIMKLDDGLQLASAGILDEEPLTTELLSFLRDAVDSC